MPFKICQSCLCEIKPGKSHDCSQKTKIQNLDAFMTPKTGQSIASRFLQRQFEEGPSTSKIKMSTGGRPKCFNVLTQRGRGRGAPPISHETFLNLQTEMNLSNNDTLGIGRAIRKGAGYNSISERSSRKKGEVTGRVF